MTQIYKCPKIVDLLADYMAGDLTEEESGELKEHLEICPGCVAFIDSYKTAGVVCKKVLQKEMPDKLKETLADFLSKNLNPDH